MERRTAEAEVACVSNRDAKNCKEPEIQSYDQYLQLVGAPVHFGGS